MTAGGEPFVRLLGPVQFVTGGQETLDLPSVTQRQVVAALALEPGAAVRADLLCERLGLSAGALRTTVSRIRGRVGAEVVATDALGYRITCGTDAEAFAVLLRASDRADDRMATLERALGLWKGPALDEFRHEAWCEGPVFRLDELRALAVEELAEAQIDAGLGGEAIAALNRHIAEQPLRDRPRGLQIRALASVGRQADALRAYQAYRRHLAEETGTEPSREVTEIERRVASGWDGRSSAAEPATPRREDGARAGDADWSAVPLPPALAALDGDSVGRVGEVAALQAQLRAVLDGRGARAVVVGGEAGIGKTTLVAAFARGLHEAGLATVLYGRCPDGADDPLQPFRSVVATLVDAAPVELLAAHAQHRGGDLVRIAPGIAHRTWVPVPTTADEATERHQLFGAIADLLGRAAEAHPLVIVLDDLHRAQATALTLTRHLMSELGGAPILLLATVRDQQSDVSDDLLATLSGLAQAGAPRMVLGGFDDVELGELVQGVAGSTGPVAVDLLEALRLQTAGNPLYAVQLTRHLLEMGVIVANASAVRLAGPLDEAGLPASLADLVWARVRRLGRTTAEVLRSASVLGTAFEPELLAEVSGETDEAVELALRAGQRAQLLEEGGDGEHLCFVHGLVARALYDDLPPTERRQLHRRAADALEREADHLRMATVAQLARQRALAGDRSAALRWCTLAGDRSLAQLASTEAAHWYAAALGHARALERPPEEEARILVRLARAQQRCSELAGARASVLEAAALARRAHASDVLVDAALAGDPGHIRATSADPELLDLLDSALEVVDPDDTTRRARLLAQHAQELVHTDRDVDRERSALLAIELSERSEDPTLLAQLVAQILYGLWGLGPLALRAEVARRAEVGARRSPDPLVQFGSARASYLVAVESADPERAAASLARMRQIAEKLGDRQLRWAVGTYDVFELTMSARLDAAEARAGDVLELGLRIGEPDALSIYSGQVFVLRSFAYRYDELTPLLDDLVEANPQIATFALARAIACAVTGRTAVAQEFLDASLDAGFGDLRNHFWLTALVGHAVLAIELDDVVAAEALYPLLEPYARQSTFNGATSQGPVVAYLGKLASLLGRHEVADAHLHEALAIEERCGWRYHQATTLLALATSRVRATGALGDAERAWLDEAIAIAEECGLQGVLRHGAALAEAST